MTQNRSLTIETLPESEGIFCLYNQERQPLYIGAAKNVKAEVNKFLLSEPFNIIEINVAEIEFIESNNNNLVKLFTAAIKRKKPLYNVSLAEQKLYPHLKITREKFPRLLVTRKIETDKADYFGAFLSETDVRFLINFLNRTFRLRSCAIPIDGNFLSPCTMYYEKKCVAPCVANICDKNGYDEFVNFVRLFLQNDRDGLQSCLLKKIAAAAEDLDFETATYQRDILAAVQNFWNEKSLHIWLNDTIDSFEIEEKNGRVFIYLATQRGRKILGRRIFVFEAARFLRSEIILSQVLWQFYQFHAPREIRVPKEFSNRQFLAEILSCREKRRIKINIISSDNKKKTTERAFGRTKFEFDLRQIKLPTDYREIQTQLKKQLNLNFLPKRIECFDVAHTSNTDFAAAKVVWENGKFSADENRHWFFEEASELKMLEKAIEKSFEENPKLPDLIVIDGGKPQLNAALKVFNKLDKRKFSIMAAVKPPKRHNQVSHFIMENGQTIQMNPESEAMQFLVRLRDEAHELANRLHRTQRDAGYFYELAHLLPFLTERERNYLLQKLGSIRRIRQTSQKEFSELLGFATGEKIFLELNATDQKFDKQIKPFIVPIRFDDPGGEAEDLQPLKMTYKK